MKKIKISIILYCILLCFTLCIKTNVSKVKAYSKSHGEIVLEASTGRVLYEYNMKKRLPMASTTKILTAITAIENGDLNQDVYVTNDTCGIEGSSIYLKDGDIFTLKDLLYGLMLRSGNDCAETIALAVGKTRKNFISLMNDTAKKCGAIDTKVTNPHGLHDENHYTTAYDLATITAYAFKNEIFREICSTKSITVTEKSTGNKRTFVNKNKLLSRYEGANGVKTGFTKKAGRCLVSSAKRDEMQLICVVLNSPQMFERSQELLNNCFNNYKMKTIISKNEFKYKTTIKGCENSTFSLKINNDVKIPLKNDEKVKIEVNLPKSCILPKYNDDIIGKIDFFIENNLIFSEKIYTIESIENIKYYKLLVKLAENFFRRK